MRKLAALLVVLLLVNEATTCVGQYWRRGYGYPVVVPNPYAGYGYGFGYGYGPFSTDPYSSAAHGMADIIRSRGQAAQDYSRAAMNSQEAYSRYLDNSLKYVDIYWQRKQIAQENFEKRYQDIRERRAAYLDYQRKMAAMRPTLTQLDPSTGEIAWPEALMGPEYIAYRAKLEEMFDLRSTASTSVPGLSNQIYSIADAMQEVLKGQITKLAPNQYIDARKFLEGMKNEARYPTL